MREIRITKETQQATKTFWQKNNWVLDFLLLSSFLCLFYCLWLGHYPAFNPDESRYSEVAREMLVSHDFITPRIDGVPFLDKPALYYWLQAVAITLFGIKEFAIRFFPMIFGLLGCMMVYIAGSYLYDRRTAVFSTMILAVSPIYFGSAHYANLDLEVAVLISSTLLTFLIAVRSNTTHRKYFLIASYVFAALAFLTKGMIGIVFPTMIIGAWILCTSQWRLLTQIHLIKGLLLFCLITLPWYTLVQKANPNFLQYFFVTQQITRFLSAAKFNNQASLWFYIPIIFLGFFPWSLLIFPACARYFKHIRHTLKTAQTEIFLMLWVTLIFIFFTIPSSKIASYMLPVFPALALLVGNYLANKFQITEKKLTAMITCYGIILFCLSIIAILVPFTHWLKIPYSLRATFITMGILFFISSLFIVWSLLRKKVTPFFISAAATNIFFLLLCVFNAAQLNSTTTKPLTHHLQALLKPTDEVVIYKKYYQDVSLYLNLNKPITIVSDWQAPNIAMRDNWKRELWLGMSFQNTDPWLINEDTFWQRWQSNQRMFVFINKHYFEQFKQTAKKYFWIDNYHDIILLSNQPDILK